MSVPLFLYSGNSTPSGASPIHMKDDKNGIIEPGTFFVFNDNLQREQDDPKDVILFFYPYHIPLEEQLFLIGAISAMIGFSENFSSESRHGLQPLEILQLGKSKLAIHTESDGTTFVFTGKPMDYNEFLQKQLKELIGLFEFISGSMIELRKRIFHSIENNDNSNVSLDLGRDLTEDECRATLPQFLQETRKVFRELTPMIQQNSMDPLNFFAPLSYISIPVNHYQVFLEALQLVNEQTEREKNIYKGCIFYDESILCSDMDVKITKFILNKLKFHKYEDFFSNTNNEVNDLNDTMSDLNLNLDSSIASINRDFDVDINYDENSGVSRSKWLNTSDIEIGYPKNSWRVNRNSSFINIHEDSNSNLTGDLNQDEYSDYSVVFLDSNQVKSLGELVEDEKENLGNSFNHSFYLYHRENGKYFGLFILKIHKVSVAFLLNYHGLFDSQLINRIKLFCSSRMELLHGKLSVLPTVEVALEDDGFSMNNSILDLDETITNLSSSKSSISIPSTPKPILRHNLSSSLSSSPASLQLFPGTRSTMSPMGRSSQDLRKGNRYNSKSIIELDISEKNRWLVYDRIMENLTSGLRPGDLDEDNNDVLNACRFGRSVFIKSPEVTQMILRDHSGATFCKKISSTEMFVYDRSLALQNVSSSWNTAAARVSSDFLQLETLEKKSRSVLTEHGISF